MWGGQPVPGPLDFHMAFPLRSGLVGDSLAGPLGSLHHEVLPPGVHRCRVVACHLGLSFPAPGLELTAFPKAHEPPCLRMERQLFLHFPSLLFSLVAHDCHLCSLRPLPELLLIAFLMILDFFHLLAIGRRVTLRRADIHFASTLHLQGDRDIRWPWWSHRPARYKLGLSAPPPSRTSRPVSSSSQARQPAERAKGTYLGTPTRHLFVGWPANFAG